MIRLLGIVSGAALAVVTLLLLVGIPEFDTRSENSGRDIVTLPRPTAPVEPVAQATTPEGLSSDEDSGPEPVSGDDEATGTAGDEQHGEAPFLADGSTETYAETLAPRREPEEMQTPVSPDTAAVTENWYAFWSPFRSELAASGFVRQLQSVTALDYRVVRIRPGVYEVAFAYTDDAEIGANLSQIATATGIEFEETP